MSLVKYNSLVDGFAPMAFSNLIDRFLNESVVRNGGSTSTSFIPKVDVIENDNAYEIQVAIPGVKKEDFKIDVNEKRLTISGERKFTKETSEKNYKSVETQYGSFSRSFTLPENVDGSKISAKYTDGILEVTVPKDEKKVLKTTIKVD